jgi:hypothetical protein
LASGLAAQPTRPVRANEKSAIDPLIGLAYAASPEVGADALIRIVKLGGVKEKAGIDLLDRAFQLAQGASFAVAIRSVTPLLDSRAGRIELALRPGLDRTSLQSRIVEQLLSMGQLKAAFKLFERIRLPEIPPASCEDAWVQDPTRFYTTLSNLEARFSEDERNKGHDLAFVANYVYGVTSISQVDPVVQVLLPLTKRDGSSRLVEALASRLAVLPADDRTFASWKQTAVGAVAALARQSEARGIPADSLRTGMSGFLLRQYSGVHCRDSGTPAEYRADLSRFLSMLSKRSDGSVFAMPELPEDIDRRGEAMKAESLWESPESRALLESFRMISSGQQVGRSGKSARAHTPVTESQRLVLVSEFQKKVDQWQPETRDGSRVQYYEKAELLRMLIRMSQDDETTLSACRSLLAFLGANLSDTRRIEWVGYLTSFLIDVYSYSPPVRDRLLSEMADHQVATVALTTRLMNLERSGRAKTAGHVR